MGSHSIIGLSEQIKTQSAEKPLVVLMLI